MSKKLDTISWFICTLHDAIGHDATAAFLGEPIGDKQQCILCQHQRGEATKDDVIEQLGTA